MASPTTTVAAPSIIPLLRMILLVRYRTRTGYLAVNAHDTGALLPPPVHGDHEDRVLGTLWSAASPATAEHAA
jgi:hypothetical protein